MNRMQQLGAVLIAAATLLTPSLFADSRHRGTTNARADRGVQVRGYVVEGRIRDIDRDRNGFVIRLDNRDEVFFAPVQTRVNSHSRRGRERVRDLERGDVIRATVSRGSNRLPRATSITLLRNEDRRDDRNDRWISGVVNDVDRNAIIIREERTGRVIRVDTREIQRTVRRGDYVAVRGDWNRRGVFEAERLQLRGSMRY